MRTEHPMTPIVLGAGLLLAQAACLSSLAADLGAVPSAPASVALSVADAALAAPAATDPAGGDVVVRLYYGDRERLTDLVGRFDVFETADHEAGYVVARLRAVEYEELARAGYRLEVDAALTAQANVRLRRSAAQPRGIPGFSCYRTVEETLATLERIAAEHPDLATLRDIGDSWEKSRSDGESGYDLLVLVLGSRARPGPKPRLMLMAEHHARELVTAELATRFAEDLVGGYGVDPEATWLLDYRELHILPMANPDGRKWAEQGHWWRKNTVDTNGCSVFPSYGTDLNRNCGFKWGGVGASSLSCSELYRGPGAFSDPENQAIRDYVRSLFPDQRGPADADPAPAGASGLLISLHSYGQLVLFPWGWTAEPAPNHEALRTLGARFGYFNRYTVQPSNRLYPTSGTADEWAYGELGLAAYTFELGTAFFELCAAFEQEIYPSNRLALRYAAKACRQPYLDPSGPDVRDVAVEQATNRVGSLVRITAIADATRLAGVVPAIPLTRVAAVRYSVDDPSWIPATTVHPLGAADGGLDAPVERVEGSIDTSRLAPGRHAVFVEAQSADGRWGVPTAVFLWVEPLVLTGAAGPDGFVLSWPGVTNRFYAVLRWDVPGGTASVLAPSVPGTPPTNRVVDPLPAARARFYQVQLKP